jgi:hypothetical protein
VQHRPDPIDVGPEKRQNKEQDLSEQQYGRLRFAEEGGKDLSSELGTAREQLGTVFDDDLAGLWQDHALGPPVAYDAIARRWLTRPVSARNYCRGSATAIPLADSTIDTVVMTWTLCSITDPLARFLKARRQTALRRTSTLTRA